MAERGHNSHRMGPQKSGFAMNFFKTRAFGLLSKLGFWQTEKGSKKAIKNQIDSLMKWMTCFHDDSLEPVTLCSVYILLQFFRAFRINHG